VKELVKMSETGAGGEFQLDDFLPYKLAVASDNVSRLMMRQYLDQIGLGIPEWRLLAAVGRHGVLSPTSAGEHTSMDKVKVSRAAASLSGRGLLKQSQDPNDGRGRLLRLTRKGTTIYTGIPAMARTIDKAILAGLTATDWSNLQKILMKLVDHTRTILKDDPVRKP
jgi:DNA-binding MarR family transcriptional regulator